MHDAQRLSDRLFGRKSDREQKQMEAIVRAAHGAVSAAPARPRVLLVRVVAAQPRASCSSSLDVFKAWCTLRCTRACLCSLASGGAATVYACSLAAGAESLAIGGRRGCRALSPLRDVDPVRAATVRPYVLRTVDWSLAVADYLLRARRCLGAVPRRVSVRGKSMFSSCARWGSLCLLTLQWCSPCDGPRPPPHHPVVHCAMVVPTP